MINQKSSFALLKSKAILAILDGDKQFEKIPRTGGWPNEVIIAMPYLSGTELCNISSKFGLPQSYSWGGGAKSRWEYFSELISYCISKKTVSDLLSYLFSKEQFGTRLQGLSANEVEEYYARIVRIAIDQINGELYFGGNELAMIGKRFVIKARDEKVEIEAPAIKTIDRGYIKDISERAMNDVNEGNFDSAVTKSRTLLEEVFCYEIEKKGETPSDSGEIGKLYKQVKDLYKMHADKDTDKRINTLLSGLEKIVTSIAEMRNEGSDSHGVGARRINIAEHHARLYVNSAMAMAEFILSVGNKQEDKVTVPAS